jgi:hypothetical protein
MPLRWKIFRTICIIQLLAASFFSLKHVITSFRFLTFSNIAGLGLFTAILFLCVLGINLVNNNYPDEPVDGAQKKTFNRTFLLNFLMLSFLFGFTLAEFRELKSVATLYNTTVFELPPRYFIILFSYLLVLVLQLFILYGLFKLRLELSSNFRKRKFEFED